MPDAQKPGQKLLPQKAESPVMKLVSNTLAILGFVILAVIIVWGLLHIVDISKTSLGSFFKSSPASSIQITTPKNAVSGQPLTISWTNKQTVAGNYSFLYQCEKNFSFATQGQGGTQNAIPCGIAINVGSSLSATMLPQVTGTTAISVPVSVIFTPTSTGTRAEASANISIAPGSGTSVSQATSTPTKTEPAPVKTTPSKPAPSHSTGNLNPVAHAASGPADLSVRIIGTGYIDPASGALLMNRAPMPGDTVGVEFDIANVGGSSTGSWYFEAHLPTITPYIYTSPRQVSLAPGAHIVNTLKFTQILPGGGMFTVIADPSHQVNDVNWANNESAVSVY